MSAATGRRVSEDSLNPQPPSVLLVWLQAVLRGSRNRCPACGRGRIFASLVRMNEGCDHCGVIFQPNEGDFLGAVAIAYTITAVATLCGYLLFRPLTSAWSDTVDIAVWGAFALAFYIGLYPNMKGLWVGLLYLMTGLKRDV